MTESVPLRTPLVGLNMDPDVAHYVGMLEGTIAALAINGVKYRALLELLTGDPWEETRIDFDGKVLMQLAASVLAKQTGMSPVDAKNLVARRWSQYNLPAETIVPQAVSVDEYQSASENDLERRRELSERVKTWRARQQADAAEMASVGVDLDAK
jgi:hypothetical protein